MPTVLSPEPPDTSAAIFARNTVGGAGAFMRWCGTPGGRGRLGANTLIEAEATQPRTFSGC